MNSLFALIPIAFVLSLDNFQSSIGLGTTKPPWRRIVQAALVFSACDALAPLIGVWAGNVLGRYIGDVAEYAGAAALGAYALYLVVHPCARRRPMNWTIPWRFWGCRCR